jgi:hypothetical protein
MKKLLVLSGIFLVLFFMTGQSGYSQGVLKKIKDKSEDKIVDKIFGEDKSTETKTESSGQGSSSTVTNKGGGGLSNTAPDVKQSISDAETAYKSKDYTDARYSIRQALLGIEMEMGKKVLEGLPASVNGLKKVDDEDRVTSASVGFVGLIIERVYRNDDKELRFTVGNDAALLAPANMYLNGAYVASTDDQNQKQVKFRDYRGVLEYNEGSGYKLSVPFGQSSVMIVEGVNFASEQEIMSSAEEFDIEKIKKELGEQ